MTLLLESFIRKPYADGWMSIGVAESTAEDVLAFLGKDDGHKPRIVITQVNQIGPVVNVYRGIRLSQVDTEKTAFLLGSDKEAEEFFQRLGIFRFSEAD